MLLPFSRETTPRRRCLTGLLCILLLVFGTTLQVAHTHVDHESHADCSLCVTAHAAVQIVILPTGIIAPVLSTERRTYHAARAIPLRIWPHPLWNRPPPASLTAA